MKKIFFTCVFLVIILSTVSPNRNVLKDLQISNVTANENGTSINKIKKENYDAYVNTELQKIWGQFLAEAAMLEFTQYRERKYKWTTAMGKESAVTETIKAFRERGNHIGREAVSNINLTPKPGARFYGIRKNRTVYVMRRQVTRKLTEGRDPYEAAILAQVRGDDTKLKFEGLRQPYWEGGDYVFLRTGSPTTNTPDPGKNTNPIQLFRGCDRTCNHYFKTYGRVCGHRYNMKRFKNEYKNFANICDVDHENCKDTHMRPNWHPMYRGNCSELHAFPTMVYDYMDVVARGKKYAHYVFTPRTATPPTPDTVDLEIEELQKQQTKKP